MDIRSLAASFTAQLNKLTGASPAASSTPPPGAAASANTLIVARVLSVSAPSTPESHSANTPQASASAGSQTIPPTNGPATYSVLQPSNSAASTSQTLATNISTEASSKAQTTTAAASDTRAATTQNTNASTSPNHTGATQTPAASTPPNAAQSGAAMQNQTPANASAPVTNATTQTSANAALPTPAANATAPGASTSPNPLAANSTGNKNPLAAKLPEAYQNHSQSGGRPHASSVVQPQTLSLLLEIPAAGGRGPQQLNAITDRLLTPGEQVVLKQDTAGNWRLLGATQASASQLADVDAADVKRLINPLAPLHHSAQTRIDSITESLSQHLGRAREHPAPQAALVRLHQLLQQLPEAQRTSLIPITLQNSLTALSQSALPPLPLAPANNIAHTLKLSGTQFEANLRQTLNLPAPTAEQQLLRLMHRDQKALLLQIQTAAQAQIQQLLGQAPPATIMHTLRAPPLLESSLGQLLAGLFKLRAEPNTKPTAMTQAQVLVHIKHLANLGLAKIQLQQAQSLLQRNDPDTAAQQPLHMELLIRQGAEFSPIALQLHRESLTPEEDTNTDRESATRKIWCVNLRLELADLGLVHIELRLNERQLRTRIWCDQAPTVAKLQATESELAALFAKENLELAALDIVQGEPPQKKMSIQYNLVDIKT